MKGPLLPDCIFCGISGSCRATPLFAVKSSQNRRAIPPSADRPPRRATNSRLPRSVATTKTTPAPRRASAGRGCSPTFFVPTSTRALDAGDRCAGSRPRLANPPSPGSWPNTASVPDLRLPCTAPFPLSSSYRSRAEPLRVSKLESGHLPTPASPGPIHLRPASPSPGAAEDAPRHPLSSIPHAG